MAYVTNSDRAAWAQIAIDAFVAACPTDEDDAIGDLIIDLLHAYRRKVPSSFKQVQSFLDSKFAMFETEEREDLDA